MQLETNPYLAAVMRAVRSGRPALPADQPFFTRVEKVPTGNYVEVWFRTGGCTWDRAGGCTMCNYGYGDQVTAASAVQSVQAALEELAEPAHELMVSPSGGMWDPREVPVEALPPIYELAAAAGPQRFFVETRAETVGEERVAELREAFPGVDLAVELGLESSHDGVLAFCVNKGSSTDTFTRAARLLHEHSVLVYANVSLGTAFLDRATAVRDAVATAHWALASGAHHVVVFPLHVKPYTLLNVLQKGGRYQPVSLWDLVETLYVLGPEVSSRVEIAWYKSYYDTTEKVTTSPVGCRACTPRLVDGLDRYRATQRYEIVADLQRARCRCAPEQVFAPSADASAHAPVPSEETMALSVLEQYDFLARALDLQDVWRRFEARLTPAVHGAFRGFAASRSGGPDLGAPAAAR